MKKSFRKLTAVLCLIALVAAFLCFGSVASDERTSTGYRYNRDFACAMLRYNDLAYISEGFYPVPGLENTLLSEGESCCSMVPQGLYADEDYIYVSAYCAVKTYKKWLGDYESFGDNRQKLQENENHKAHPSVIYILDRVSGNYLKTIILEDKNHVGGLTGDGKNIFIAKSEDKQVSVISRAAIDLAMATKSLTVKVPYTATVDCGHTASFVTYFRDILWVGLFNETQDSIMTGYSVSEKDFTLSETAVIPIPKKGNGACFAEYQGQVFLSVNTSYGRKFLSDVYLYTAENYGCEDMKLEKTSRLKLPPLIQNSCEYDGRVYYIYESGASPYGDIDSFMDLGTCSSPVDRITVCSSERLFGQYSCTEKLRMRAEAFFDALSYFLLTVFS